MKRDDHKLAESMRQMRLIQSVIQPTRRKPSDKEIRKGVRFNTDKNH